MAPAHGDVPGAPARMNRNVKLAYFVWFFSGTSQGLCVGPAMTAYVYFVTGGSTMQVGIVEAIKGVSNVLVGVPAAVIADRTSRSVVLQAAAAMIVLAIAGTTAALMIPAHRFELLCVALGLWGAANGMGYSALEALFADSVPTGNRISVYARKWQIGIASRGVGPALAALLFYIFGDHWRESEMRIVILVGAGLSLVSAVLMTNFRDSWALGERSEAHRTVKPKPDTHVDCVKRLPQDADDAAKGESYPLLGNRGANKGASINVVPEMPMVAPGMESKASESSRPSFRLRMIPVLIASGDVVSGLASGMTVKFFSIFFIDAVGLSPIAVSLIWAAAPFVTASFVSAARVLTKRLGRMQVYIMFKMAGISMLVFMATFPRYWAVPYAIIPVYIFRTALMNSPRFVLKTIMMDYVPKANRGKWISFDLVFAVGWSGSAALGGYFVKTHGWTFTFLITATMQALALLPSFVLLAIVPKHESARTSAADGKQ